MKNKKAFRTAVSEMKQFLAGATLVLLLVGIVPVFAQMGPGGPGPTGGDQGGMGGSFAPPSGGFSGPTGGMGGSFAPSSGGFSDPTTGGMGGSQGQMGAPGFAPMGGNFGDQGGMNRPTDNIQGGQMGAPGMQNFKPFNQGQSGQNFNFPGQGKGVENGFPGQGQGKMPFDQKPFDQSAGKDKNFAPKPGENFVPETGKTPADVQNMMDKYGKSGSYQNSVNQKGAPIDFSKYGKPGVNTNGNKPFGGSDSTQMLDPTAPAWTPTTNTNGDFQDNMPPSRNLTRPSAKPSQGQQMNQNQFQQKPFQMKLPKVDTKKLSKSFDSAFKKIKKDKDAFDKKVLKATTERSALNLIKSQLRSIKSTANAASRMPRLPQMGNGPAAPEFTVDVGDLLDTLNGDVADKLDADDIDGALEVIGAFYTSLNDEVVSFQSEVNDFAAEVEAANAELEAAPTMDSTGESSFW